MEGICRYRENGGGKNNTHGSIEKIEAVFPYPLVSSLHHFLKQDKGAII
jgi:hypothetical protein